MIPKLFTTLQNYSWALLRADLIAGVTVALVALPLSLAIAIASGAGPETGLITAIVGGFLISALGGSRVQIGGPTGAFIVVVQGVILTHGYDGLVLATLMAGVLLLLAGWLRAGSLIRHVPEPVIDGFTIGIAIIIATSQLKDLFGMQFAHAPEGFVETLAALWAAVGSFAPVSFAVGLATMLGIIALRRAFPRLPGLILVMAAMSALVALLGLPVETIQSRFGALPATLPLPSLPEIGYARLIALLPSACIIAFLAGVESLLSAMVADRMISGAHRSNAEIIAQGAANIGSSLFGGLPATGAIARTATNVRAGGQTPVAGVTHALAIALVMLVAAPLAGYLVMPAMAGLLILTAWNMSEPHKWPSLMKLRRTDKALLVITLVLTVVADLTIAIGVGVTLGLAIRMRRRDVPPADWHTPER